MIWKKIKDKPSKKVKIRKKKRKEAPETSISSHFFRFFMVFSGIFLVMTFIILQVMRHGIYSSIDNNLKSITNDGVSYAEMAISRTEVSSEKITTNIKFRPSNPTSANTTFLIFNKEGVLLNHMEEVSENDDNSIDPETLNTVIDEEMTNVYGQAEKYHTITIRVSSSLYPDIAYMKAAVNVEQIDQAKNRYEQIVIIVMFIFWLVSIGASIYLANWSRKPVIESFDRQKAFVENASHELRTPLSVLQNRLETLFRKPNETILENSENIASSLDEVRNIRLLTTNLLNLARRDDGIEPILTEIESSEFDAIFDDYSLIAKEANKTFISHNLVSDTVICDKTLLKQLMTILFDNAIKYTDNEGIIEFTVKSKDKQIILKIADNGFGISDDDKKKIFDRFYRVDKARTRQKGGFGLGLSLAQQIVKTLKGTITVNDNRPKGTIFEIKL